MYGHIIPNVSTNAQSSVVCEVLTRTGIAVHLLGQPAR